MFLPIITSLRLIQAKVHKGDIRNTVLRQIKQLKHTTDLLNQGKRIKQKEIEQYKDKKPEKSKKLEKQVEIIDSGLLHIQQALKILDHYKKTSVH
jgi:hypothetical protein